MSPVHVKKVGKKFCSVDATGKVKKGRCFPSRKQATKQVQAININLRRNK